MSAKHFIIDDTCCYIGSQNMYICDLAEWGVVIDDAVVTTNLKKQYWCVIFPLSYGYQMVIRNRILTVA
jgi:phosphatidylserine/phosphatidylglycerophosphate/cardiolipin synthase-like enzyme